MLPPSSFSSSSSATGISRSFENLSAFLSHRLRPWPTLYSSLSPPLSLSSALSRLSTNSRHFLPNYALLVSASAALSLLLSSYPFSAVAYSLVLIAWLLGYFFRDDPLVIYDRHVDDPTVLIGLVLGTVLVVWLIGMVNTVFTGVFVGVLISTVHAVFKDTDGLFLDEDDAATNGLIASGSRSKAFSV